MRIAVSALAFLITTTTAQAQSFTLFDLSVLPPQSGGYYSYGLAISNTTAPMTAGYSTSANGERATLNNKNGLNDLGALANYTRSSYAYGINNSGTVVGSSINAAGNGQAFVFQNNQMSALGALTGQTSSAAYSINNNGIAVGSAVAGFEHAVVFRNGTATDLGTLGGTTSVAYAINDQNVIVGTARSATQQVAFREDLGSASGMQALGILPGGSYSVATAVSSTGLIVGYSGSSDGERAVSFQNGQIASLGILPGGTFSEAYGVNSAGDIVGDADTLGGQSTSFYYHNGVMKDLSTLILTPGTKMFQARGINDQGWIIGTAVLDDKHVHAVALQPNFAAVPEPSSFLLIACGGGCLLLALRRRAGRFHRAAQSRVS